MTNVEGPLDCQEIKPANPKGSQPWILTGRIDAEASILWSPDVKSELIGKDPDAGKDWRQEEKEMTEDEMVGWHHWLNGHEFEQTPRDGEGHGSLVHCSSWGCKESNDLATEQQQMWVSETILLLGWPKSLFGFTCHDAMLKLDKLFGQPNTFSKPQSRTESDMTEAT